MGQITIAFAEIMLKHAEGNEHSPLTVWEEKQLALAWLELKRAKDGAEQLMHFYSVTTIEALIAIQNHQIERLQAKLRRDTDSGRPNQVRA